ncbi:reverse transcriptase domain-containing protein [Listeria rocourtiae]|uniref:reverse transcriptase domain-containing protein n=1 Tax=Listeria rocourtiae TaxID=647910 RepID=UPI00162A19DF|nr:reverse transcriptase domain-containing protein [Listeria rocourtiae]
MRRKLLKSQLRVRNIKSLSEKTIKFYHATGLDNINYSTYKKREDAYLNDIRKDIIASKYKFVRYKEKLIVKSRHAFPRCISIPTLKDKLTHKIILETLKEYYPSKARTQLPQECIKEIREELGKGKYTFFIKLDLSNFYGNLNHELLEGQLKMVVKDKLLLRLILSAIKTPTFPEQKQETIGIPQGLSISNILAHIYMQDFDSLTIEEDFFMIRYVDDILILCHQGDQELIYNKLRSFLENNLKLVLNSKKEMRSALVDDSFDYLGYELGLTKGNKPLVSVKKKNMEKIEKRIINLITKYKYQSSEGWKNFSTDAFIFELNIIITGAIAKKIDEQSDTHKRYGWIFFYSQINQLDRLYHLDNFISKQVKNLNIPTNDKKKIKKFSKAYREVRYNLANTNYIFRPDNLSADDKKEILRYYNIPIVKLRTDTDVEKFFRKIVYKKIKENEIDILQGIS